jgi:hypothetical protein
LLWQKKSIVLQQIVPKAQVWVIDVWVIDEVITSTLNPIVLACVMNWCKDHWLLLDVLTTIITHGHGSYATTTSFNKFEIFDPFDVDTFFLHNNMWLEVVFWCTICSQHDDYHVGSTLQGFTHYGILSGKWECNLTSI